MQNFDVFCYIINRIPDMNKADKRAAKKVYNRSGHGTKGPRIEINMNEFNEFNYIWNSFIWSDFKSLRGERDYGYWGSMINSKFNRYFRDNKTEILSAIIDKRIPIRKHNLNYGN